MAYNEVAGPYAGVVFGISNTFASMTGIFVPYFVAAVTKNVNFRIFVSFFFFKLNFTKANSK